MGFVLKYSVDLVLQLIDTVTGRAISGYAEILYDGQPCQCINKGGGNVVLVNSGRENATVSIKVQGYYPAEVFADRDKIRKKLPLLTVHLVLEERFISYGYFVLEGKLDGITHIEAVNRRGITCRIKSFDSRTRKLDLINPHGLELSTVYYAVIDKSAKRYERFEIQKRISETEYKTAKELSSQFRIDDPVGQICFGFTKPDGSYKLILHDGGDSVFYVRYEVNGSEHFAQVDFKRPETTALSSSDGTA